MIKANAEKKKKTKKLAVSEQQLEELRGYLTFPIDTELRERRSIIRDLASYIRNNESNIRDYENVLERERNSLARNTEHLGEENAKLPKIEKLASTEEAAATLQAVAELPWIQTVSLDNTSLMVLTEPGVLVTTFDTRTVELGPGMSAPEFMEPVVAPLPQYFIRVLLDGMGYSMTTNERLSISLADKNDTEHFIAGKIAMQQMNAHWASNDRGRFGDWGKLCLGEYEKELMEASKEGLIPFFTELATYLQTSGDEHAYRPKQQWAIAIGKKEYQQFLRPAKEKETYVGLMEKYREDFKKYRQPHEKGLGQNHDEGPVQFLNAIEDLMTPDNGYVLGRNLVVAAPTPNAGPNRRERRQRVIAANPVIRAAAPIVGVEELMEEAVRRVLDNYDRELEMNMEDGDI